MVTRIGGLISGIDTDQLIKTMLSAQRSRLVDRFQQQNQILAWKQEIYRETRTKMLALRSAANDIKVYNAIQSKIAKSSNENAVKAAAGAGAAPGTYTIDVYQLAKGASVEGNPTTWGENIDYGSDQTFYLLGENKSEWIKVTIGQNDNIYEVVNKINAVTNQTGVRASYDASAKKFQMVSTKTGSDANIAFLDTDGFLKNTLGITEFSQGQDARFKINGVEMTSSSNNFEVDGISYNLLKAGTPAVAASSKISAATGAAGDDVLGVAGKWSFQITTPFVNGEQIEINGKTYNFVNTIVNPATDVLVTNANTPALQALALKGLLSADTDFDNIDVQVNGGLITFTEKSGFEGLTILTTNPAGPGVSSSAQDPGTPAMPETVTITVSHDADKGVDYIKAFVEAYNNLMTYMSEKMGEKAYRDYPPLTDEQRDAMTDKEIERWEERAKSGLLRGDSTYSNIYNSLRLLSMDSISLSDDKLYSLMSWGIGTSDWQDKGKLYIDEAKLRSALETNLDKIDEFFNGFTSRLWNDLTYRMSTVDDRNGSSGFGGQIDRNDQRIAAGEKRLNAMMERYYKQFAAMETALSRMQTQSDWLTAQLSAFTGSNS